MFCFMMLYPACRDIFQCIIFQIVQMCLIYSTKLLIFKYTIIHNSVLSIIDNTEL